MRFSLMRFLSLFLVSVLLPVGAQGGLLDNLEFFPVTQKVRDAVYDSSRDLIYGSVPSRSTGQNANSLVTIDPSTGEVLSSLFVGDDPHQLAISSDNSRVYIGVDGENAFRWWQPGDGQLGELRELRTNIFGNATTAVDIAVRPGQADVVVVAKSSGISEEQLEVFNDEGSRTYAASRPANSIDFLDSDSLITANNQDSARGMQRLGLTGIELFVELSSSNGGGFNTEIEVGRDQRIYDSAGRIFDAATFSALGRLNPSIPYDQSRGLVEPVPELGLIYSVVTDSPLKGNDVRLAVFKGHTFEEIDFATLHGRNLEERKGASLFVAGENRLAFTSSSTSFPFERDLTIITDIPVVVPEPSGSYLIFLACCAGALFRGRQWTQITKSQIEMRSFQRPDPND